MHADREEEARLSEAAKVSMETQQMTPLIKEELRLSIMKKRHASGQEEIKVEFPEPKQYELTPYEKAKRERRREQNRRAAQRCRQKKKQMQSGKQEVFSTIINQNNKLQAEVKKLRKERRDLDVCLKKHITSGCCQLETEALQLLQPHVDLSPIASAQTQCPILIPNAQTLPTATTSQVDGVLPSFVDTFLENVSPSMIDHDVFQFSPDMRTEYFSTRTWSGTSDDVTPPDSLPETIFDASAQDDDVFYDNDQLPEKVMTSAAYLDPCILNAGGEHWAHFDMVDVLCPNQNFDPSLVNEP